MDVWIFNPIIEISCTEEETVLNPAYFWITFFESDRIKPIRRHIHTILAITGVELFFSVIPIALNAELVNSSHHEITQVSLD